MDINIRRAHVDDAKQVAEVMNSVIGEGKYTLFDEPFSEEQERQFIASLGARSAVFVAEAGEIIVGVQSVDLYSEIAPSVQHVATLGTWVRHGFRGRGIGHQLAENSLAFARQQGYRKIVIQVLAGNEHALNFYRSLGFREIGVARQQVILRGEFYDEVFLEMML